MLCGASLHACAPQEQHIFNVLETNMYQQVWAQISVDPLFSVPQPRDILCAFMNLQTYVFFFFLCWFRTQQFHFKSYNEVRFRCSSRSICWTGLRIVYNQPHSIIPLSLRFFFRLSSLTKALSQLKMQIAQCNKQNKTKNEWSSTQATEACIVVNNA